MNILVLAANYTDLEAAKKIVKVWLSTKHLGQRHARRVTQIVEMEKKLKKGKQP